MMRPESNRPGLAATMSTEWAAALRLASHDFTQQLRRKCGCRRFDAEGREENRWV
jgi:hypothetical protein